MIFAATAHAAPFTIDTSTISSLLIGIVIPFLVDLVTKSAASPRLKALIATALAALSGALSTVIFDPSTGWQGYLYNIAFGFLTVFATHATGVTDGVQRRTAHKGVGKPRKTRNTINPSPTGPADTRPPGTAHAGVPGKGTPPTKRVTTKKTTATRKTTPPRKRT